MPDTISIEDVSKILDIARFHLRCFDAEHHKLSDRNVGALEAYFVACLLCGGSVFYTLVNRKDVINPFWNAVGSWKAQLEKERKDDYAFFFRMVEHRGSVAHVSSVATELAMSAISAHLFPDVHSFSAPLDSMVANPVPGGSPAFASAWVMINKLRLDGQDALTHVGRFLNLLDELVQYCRAAQSSGPETT